MKKNTFINSGLQNICILLMNTIATVYIFSVFNKIVQFNIHVPGFLKYPVQCFTSGLAWFGSISGKNRD